MSINNKDIKSSLKEERMQRAEVPIEKGQKYLSCSLKFSMKFSMAVSEAMFNIEWL
jgi:hypothetical protein